MNNQTGFITKVFLLSLGIALLIKAAGLWIDPTTGPLAVLAIVLMPSLVIGLILTSRALGNFKQ